MAKKYEVVIMWPSVNGKPLQEQVEQGGFDTVVQAVAFCEKHIGKLGPRTRRNFMKALQVKRNTGVKAWIREEKAGKPQTATEKLNKQSARKVKKQRADREATGKLQRDVADGKITAGKALQQQASKGKRKKLSDMVKRAKQNAEPKQKTTGAKHGIVMARAGTGKTFTLVIGVAFCYWTAKLKALCKKHLGFDPIPSAQQQAIWEFMAEEHFKTAQYIAFNKSIVKEFGFVYKWLVKALTLGGCTLSFSTIHSMGFRVCCKAYGLKGRRAVNKWKVRDLLSAHWECDIREVWKEKQAVIQATEELVGKCKINLVGWDGNVLSEPTDDDLDQLCDHYEVQCNGDKEEIYELVRLLLVKCREDIQAIDFNDQLWLPVVDKLPVPVYDLLMVDEGQDLNRCQQEFALRGGSRILLVGDPKQAIYGFAGADTESIPRMTERLASTERGVQEFKLTVTRRCAKAVVREAQRLVPDFEAHPDNPEGEVLDMPLSKAAEEYADKDMVLCRVNAPLIGTAFSLLKQGRKANIQGRDIGQGLKAIIVKSNAKEVSELVDWVDTYERAEMEKLAKRRNPDEAAQVALTDKCDCIRIVCEGAFTLKEVKENIDAIFQGRQCPKCKKRFNEDVEECYSCKVETIKPDGVLLSSIHRAKGLEADRVFIMQPELLPHPMAKTDWAREQEGHLEYVAITRAKHTLVYARGEQV